MSRSGIDALPRGTGHSHTPLPLPPHPSAHEWRIEVSVGACDTHKICRTLTSLASKSQRPSGRCRNVCAAARTREPRGHSDDTVFDAKRKNACRVAIMVWAMVASR